MSTIAYHDSSAILDSEACPVAEIAPRLAKAGLVQVKLIDLQNAAVQNAIAFCEGNRTHAAHMLGIAVRTLQRWLKESGAEGDILPR